ncbi:MAG TPA: SGNH/GDSL hydrolase family protein [Candidatus Binatia bacterium]|nr:SGNH/GDSL hydrolase family protein [Candidatus Binatia bacterium]
MRKPSLVVLLSAALAAADAAGAAPVARLRGMVVVGDSLLSGFSSGGLVRRGHAGQVDSAPAFIARRAGVRLRQPLMTRPGVPPQLEIVDANGDGVLDRGEVRRRTSRLGFRADPDQRVRNLAVPGEDSATVFEEIAPEDVAGQIVGGDVNGREILKFMILGLPLRSEGVSQVRRTRELKPHFVLVWLGNNDLLDLATKTDPNAVTIGAPEFGRRFRRLLDALAESGPGMAVANLPDPTGIAALRRASTDVTACRTTAGTTEPVAPDDLLSIDLDPGLLPVPPCHEVLNATERAAVRAIVDAFNAEIAAAVAETAQARGVTIALVDLAARFDRMRTDGVDVDGDGRPDLDTRYLGGIFSLDGVHPTATGNALIANAFIEAINAGFGEAIPAVNVARVAARDPLVGNAFRPAGEPPFGLVSEDSNDELEDFFDRIGDRITDGVEDLRDDLEDLLDEIF